MEKLFFALVFTLSFITISQATEIEKTWEVVGFSMPEPVVVSPKDQWIYVSNINGDKNGFISRIAGKSAKFRQRELQAGLIPGFGGMQRLQRHVGLSRAMEMMLSGRFIDAEEALSKGLVTSVVADSEVVSEAITLCQNLIDNLDKNALAIFKKRMAASYDDSFSVALASDQLAFDQLATSEEAKAAIARFVKKQQEE